jgi:hypothetical protein
LYSPSYHTVPIIEEVEVLPQLPLNTGEVVKACEVVDDLGLGRPQWPKARCAYPCLLSPREREKAHEQREKMEAVMMWG